MPNLEQLNDKWKEDYGEEDTFPQDSQGLPGLPNPFQMPSINELKSGLPSNGISENKPTGANNNDMNSDPKMMLNKIRALSSKKSGATRELTSE
jgi:hypothetical protein